LETKTEPRRKVRQKCIPVEEHDAILCKFFAEVERKGGAKYQAGVLAD